MKIFKSENKNNIIYSIKNKYRMLFKIIYFLSFYVLYKKAMCQYQQDGQK